MEQKVHQLAASARLRSVVESDDAAVPLSGISLEARLREAREKREHVLAEKALHGADGDAGPERRGNFEFGPAPFERDTSSKTEGLPFVGMPVPVREPSVVEDDPSLGSGADLNAAIGITEFRRRETPAADPGFRGDTRRPRSHVANPKIAECSSAPAESTDTSRWGLDPDDDILINPKIVESMLPFVPYQVSGDEDPWFSPSAKDKLKVKKPRPMPLDPSSFIPVGEDFDLGTPVELKAVFDEVKFVHARRRTKIRLVRVLAILALIAAGIMIFPVLKGGFQPALESILLSGTPGN